MSNCGLCGREVSPAVAVTVTQAGRTIAYCSDPSAPSGGSCWTRHLTRLVAAAHADGAIVKPRRRLPEGRASTREVLLERVLDVIA